MQIDMIAAFTGTELMWIAIVVLVLFGAKKVPELMRGVGQGIKEFKKATKDVQDEVHRALDESDREVPKPRKSEHTVSQDPYASRESVEPTTADAPDNSHNPESSEPKEKSQG